MKKNRLIPLLLALVAAVGLLAPFTSLAIEPMDVAARHAILIDAEYGDILYEKDARSKAYPASITKVMTALLVIEAIQRGELALDQMVVCSVTAHEGMSIYGSTQDIQPGESMSVKDLLYCLMLASANESANILAEAVSGDVETFVALMNRRAGELGCEGTHYTNTHGLHDDDHYTTAYDVALVFAKGMEYDLFRQLVSTASYQTAATERKGPREFYNTNALISRWYYTDYFYDKAIGGKTGTTEEAGNCLVSAAKNGDEYLISVVLGAQVVTRADGTKDRQQYSESRRLLQWGFSSFKRFTIAPGDAPVAAVKVTLSQETDEVLVRPMGSIERTLPRDTDVEAIAQEVRLFTDTVEAPVKEGQLMGTLTLTYEGEEYGVLDLVALNDVERSEFLYKKAQIVDFFQESGTKLILASVLVIAALILLRLLVFRKRRAPSSGGRRGSYSGRNRR